VKKVYYQGERGSFSELAAQKFFRGRTDRIGVYKFEDVFAAIKGHRDRYGVIPIENSLTGSIHRNYDLLIKSDLFIIGEIKHRISFDFFTAREVDPKDIKEAWSHPVAFDQCKTFLACNPDYKIVPVYDSAGMAGALAAAKRHDVGLIAGPQVGRIHRLHVVKENIEDHPNDFTRFLIISNHQTTCKKSSAKTSLAFGVKNAPGVLFRCLSIFALRNIDLVKLESRPIIGRPWEYLFYVDFLGSIEHQNCQKAVEKLKDETLFTKVLGCYETRQV